MIIPITVIEKKYPGGWKQYQHDNEFNAAESDDNFTDGELLRLGAMNSFSIYLIVSEWEDLGLKGYVRAGKKKKWRDFCLCNAFDGPVDCDWLAFDATERKVSWLCSGQYVLSSDSGEHGQGLKKRICATYRPGSSGERAPF